MLLAPLFVQHLVLVKVALLSKSFATLVALVRLLSSVDPHVVNEVPRLVELPASVVVLSNEVAQNPAGACIVLVCDLVLVVISAELCLLS